MSIDLDNLSHISDEELSKIIGLTVDIEIENNNEKITGNIFSVLKSHNLLILLKYDSINSGSINSCLINVKYIKKISISDKKIEVK